MAQNARCAKITFNGNQQKKRRRHTNRHIPQQAFHNVNSEVGGKAASPTVAESRNWPGPYFFEQALVGTLGFPC